MEKLPNRKELRLKGFNYSQNGCYFITICTKEKNPLLGNVVGDANLGVPFVKLTETGEMVKRHIDNITMVYGDLKISKYIIMPNHIHMIIDIENGTPGCATPAKSTPAKMIGALKSLTSRQFGKSMWQRSYYDHIIRDAADYRRIWRYIDENPAKWFEDKYYYHPQYNI